MRRALPENLVRCGTGVLSVFALLVALATGCASSPVRRADPPPVALVHNNSGADVDVAYPPTAVWIRAGRAGAVPYAGRGPLRIDDAREVWLYGGSLRVGEEFASVADESDAKSLGAGLGAAEGRGSLPEGLKVWRFQLQPGGALYVLAPDQRPPATSFPPQPKGFPLRPKAMRKVEPPQKPGRTSAPNPAPETAP